MNLASASSREKPKVVWVRSLVPKQKKSACWAISSATAGARQLEHRAHGNIELDAFLGGNLGDHALDDLAGLDVLGRDGNERNHDLGARVDALLDKAGSRPWRRREPA